MSGRSRVLVRLGVIMIATGVAVSQSRFTSLWAVAMSVEVALAFELGAAAGAGQLPDPWVSRYGRSLWIRLPRLGPWVFSVWVRPLPDPRVHLLVGVSCFIDEDGELNAMLGIGILTVRLVSTRVRTSRRERRKIADYIAEREAAYAEREATA